MDDKSFNIRVPKRWVRVALIVGATALIVAPLTAIASHSFTDVPDSNTFHDDIAWLADAEVTKGCNPPDNTEFCPDDNVTRGQMAAFMERFASYIGAKDGTPAQADNATNADNADNATTLAGSTPGAASDQVSWSTTSNAVETLDTITVDVPAAGTVIVELTGTVHIDEDADTDDAHTVFSNIGLCDEAASSTTCADTYGSVWYQDPDDASGFNATPGVGIVRVYEMDSGGTLTVHVNGQSGSADAFNSWDTYALVTYLPGPNSLSGVSLTTSSLDGASPQQEESEG